MKELPPAPGPLELANCVAASQTALSYRPVVDWIESLNDPSTLIKAATFAGRIARQRLVAALIERHPGIVEEEIEKRLRAIGIEQSSDTTSDSLLLRNLFLTLLAFEDPRD